MYINVTVPFLTWVVSSDAQKGVLLVDTTFAKRFQLVIKYSGVTTRTSLNLYTLAKQNDKKINYLCMIEHLSTVFL